MKFFPALLLASLPLLSTAQAAPRVGEHEGFSRIVFTLPKTSTFSTSTGSGKLTIRLGQLSTPLKTEQGSLNTAGVTGYAISGSSVSLRFAPGHTKAKVSVLPAEGNQPARLIVDVPTKADTAVAGAKGTPPAVTRPASTKAVRPTVVIDAGHGGLDPGMVSQWVTEKEVTLDVALRLRDLLEKHGVNVKLVRDSDRHLSADKVTDLDARSDMAKTGEVHAYISIHVNAGNPAAQGIETYYFGKPIGGANRSLAVLENGGGSVGLNLTKRASSIAENAMGDILAQAKLSFSRQLAQKVQYSLLSTTGAVNRGVHTDAFYVIRNPKTAAILTEIGFGSSTVEGPKLATAEYRQKIAQGIGQAILSFLNMK